MDVVFFALVLLGLAAFVAAPLYRMAPPEPPEGSAADARAEAHAAALRDLEVDRASGLLDPGSYEQERAALEREALDARTRLGRD